MKNKYRIMVAINKETHDELSKIAKMEQRTLGVVVARAIKLYGKKREERHGW